MTPVQLFGVTGEVCSIGCKCAKIQPPSIWQVTPPRSYQLLEDAMAIESQAFYAVLETARKKDFVCCQNFKLVFFPTEVKWAFICTPKSFSINILCKCTYL